MKKVLFFVVIIFIIIGVFYFINKKEAIAPVVVPPSATDTKSTTVDTGPAELCFAKFGTPDKNGYYDKYTLRMILDGGKVTGELNLLPAEKDKKTGEIEGTVSAVDKTTMTRTADLWWYASAEGMNVKEQLKIIFGEGTSSIGMGEMVDRGDGVYVYKDLKNISYTLNLTDVACADLVERANVENYLVDSIADLSPVKPVLGGSWYVVSMTVNLEKNTGTVVYEDGHIQENKTFSYTVDEKGVVTGMIIK
ncbi:MAG: hypothetical protein WC609_02605 [Candidatus Paceibacterota bacterium]|jgi:hypothetical protein